MSGFFVEEALDERFIERDLADAHLMFELSDDRLQFAGRDVQRTLYCPL